MTDEIHLAFAHPEERAVASSGVEPLDRISLRDHIVAVEIGAFQTERGVTQRLSFNVVVEVRPLEEAADDDVDRILSYDKVTEAIAFELEAERLNLLETLAERVADRILLQPQAMRVFVRIEKLDRGPGALGVEIVRARGAEAAPRQGEDQPHPLVVYLSNVACKSNNLEGWITQLAARNVPLIFCVGTHGFDVPRTGHDEAQLRIDLLAIEQNAWALSARDGRCVVVGSRTELDWAMKNGQISVWAPAKLVLDSVDGPRDLPLDAMMLAQWFAKEHAASEMIAIGETLPENPAFATRSVAVEAISL